MKVFVLGVTKAQGISKKAGNNSYSIPNLTMMVDFKPYSNKPTNHNGSDPYHEVSGYGKTTSDIPIDPQIFTTFNKCTFPCWLDIQSETDYSFSPPRTHVASFTEVPKA